VALGGSRNGESDFRVRDVMNRNVALVTAISFSCLAAAAQTKPVFETVSIQPVPTPTPATMVNWRPVYNLDAARVEIRNYPLLLVLVRAFEVQMDQVVAPDFARDQYFDVQATLPAGAGKEQIREMLQQMLTERSESGVSLADGTMQITTKGKLADLFPVMGSFGQYPHPVDETGLSGLYTWVRYQAPAAAGMSFGEATHESFRNMLEAAGLKLEMRKVPKETIVVDHIEKTPTEN
jgi:hypothetical protein